MSDKKSFNPTEAEWAQITSSPGKVQQIERLGPVVHMGEVTPAQVEQIVEQLSKAVEHVGKETDLKGLRKKRPMIDRCFIFTEGGDKRSLRELTHKQFRDWAISWLTRAGFTSIDWGSPDTSAEEREDVLRQMVKAGVSPTMLLK